METHIRPAKPSDIDALVDIENLVFTSDRISRRSFLYFFDVANSEMFVAEHKGAVVGYALVMFRKNSEKARFYSLAVIPEMAGYGIGSALLAAVERAATQHHCSSIQLEVRKSNRSAIALYTKSGYRLFGEHLNYYEDHEDALRFEKPLTAN